MVTWCTKRPAEYIAEWVDSRLASDTAASFLVAVIPDAHIGLPQGEPATERGEPVSTEAERIESVEAMFLQPEVRDVLRRSAMALLALALMVGRGDPRRDVVKMTVEFAEMAPYTLGAAARPYAGYSILVREDALRSYNDLFRFFDPGDSTRTNVYEQVPSVLLWNMPVTQAHEIQYEERGDTLTATVIFDRPDRSRFTERLLEALNATEEARSPSADEQALFASLLTRGKQELQTQDTAFVTIVAGPRVLAIRTPSSIRDSVRADSLRAAAQRHLDGFVSGGTIRITEYNDYSRSSRDAGGAVKGWVHPGTEGWYRQKEPFLTVEVQCRGSNGDQHTYSRGYLTVDDREQFEEEDFLCLWSGQEGRDWSRVAPVTVEVRLVGTMTFRDSVFGPWVKVR